MVLVVPYNPEWARAFEQVRVRLLAALGGVPVQVEHVGSTSVEGLPAKPILDIAVVVESERDVPAAIAALAAIGYEHRGNLDVPGREAFRAPETTGMREHVYVVARGNKPHRDHIDFRDYLRVHPARAAEYAALKATLAVPFPTDGQEDRVGYTDAKAPFVEATLAEARADGATPTK